METVMTELNIDNWQAYFRTAKESNLLAVFDSLVSLGMRPVPIGEDSTGAIKIPIGNDWGLTDVKSRRKLLVKHIKQSVPIGIGVQADGYVVLDIDPPGKDRGRLSDAWKEAAALLLGGEDWPDTLTVKTKAGCHVWFKVTDQVKDAWQNHGKLKMSLPCGGAVEFFTGNNKQMQVATAPSEGKAIAREIMPADLPASLESAILEMLKPEPESIPTPIQTDKPATSDDEAWFMDRLEKLTVKTLNAESGKRHDTYRAAVRTMAGYAAGMNLTDRMEVVYNHLAGAHKDAKPEVSDYVLVETFKWAWAKGVEKKLDRPRPSVNEEYAGEFLGDEDTMEAANAADIIALMSQRKFLWGDNKKKIGWFQLGGVHLVEGREGTGKTRYMMDLVKRWSLDQHWPDGSKTTIDPTSKVLFVASDSHWDQIAMIAQDFGVPFENVLFAGPKTSPYDYTSIDEKATIEIIRMWCRKYNIAMIVIDTLMSSTSRPLVDRQE
jgi:molybdopterin-guanine dinucleotide biosynthesis protein